MGTPESVPRMTTAKTQQTVTMKLTASLGDACHHADESTPPAPCGLFSAIEDVEARLSIADVAVGAGGDWGGDGACDMRNWNRSPAATSPDTVGTSSESVAPSVLVASDWSTPGGSTAGGISALSAVLGGSMGVAIGITRKLGETGHSGSPDSPLAFTGSSSVAMAEAPGMTTPATMKAGVGCDAWGGGMAHMTGSADVYVEESRLWKANGGVPALLKWADPWALAPIVPPTAL